MNWLRLYRMILGVVCLASPAQAQPARFVLRGRINAQAGIVQLVPVGPSALNQTVAVIERSTTTLVNGTFQFKGWIEYPYGFYLNYIQQEKTRYRSTLFVLEKGSQTIRIDRKSPHPVLTNETMRAYDKSDSFIEEQRLLKDAHWFQAYSDSLSQHYKKGLPDSLAKVSKAIQINQQKRKAALLWGLCECSNTSFYAFWSLFDCFNSQGFNPEQPQLFSYFTDEIKQSKAGRWLAYQLNKEYRLGLGKPFPRGRYKNLKTHRLELIKPTSKYTLVEFWWSGCGSCLQHIPQLRKLHATYSKKGFAIIGISTDKTERVAQLEKLLVKYQFSWPEYLDENSVNADKNGVLFYPTYLLIDKSGRIIDNQVKLDELSTFLGNRLN